MIPRLRSRLRGGVVAVGCALSTLGCPTPLGGWDVEQLLREEPDLADPGAWGLGDLIPYPAPKIGPDAAFSAEVVRLIACRWPTGSRIAVRLQLSGVHQEWARRGIESLSAGLPGIDLEVATGLPGDASEATDRATLVGEEGLLGIEVAEFGSDRETGPSGVGDTRVACLVSARDPERLGSLRYAEIRMRTSVLDQIDRSVPIAAEDWTGAFMHELAHALGFQGHVRSGNSVLVLDQGRLRRVGRRALAGEAWRDEVLSAFYRLEVGRVLGERETSPSTRRGLRELDDRAGSGRGGLVARVGDRHAELEWTTEAGRTQPLRFPYWPHQLRSGEPLRAVLIGTGQAVSPPGTAH